jgi:hypothetical protein
VVVSEQIGAQIFIDGWGMVAPGQPELAADLARRAASVSHDGEAIYAAQVIAAMEALAFVEPEIPRLLDGALELIPPESLIRRLIGELRQLHDREPDWRAARAWLDENYGYHTFPGACHIVPNHGLVILALLYGGGDFGRSMTIVNTCGWDTDCNAGNLGCLLGLRGGLAGLEGGPDWRGPLADRLYLPTADGGRAISDAAYEALQIANIGRALRGLAPLAPKGGARYHFELPGSVQGFLAEADAGAGLDLKNLPGHSRTGSRCLGLRYIHPAPDCASRAYTATFTPPEAIDMPGYELLACPSLYPGQRLRLGVGADPGDTATVECRPIVWVYGDEDRLAPLPGPGTRLAPGEYQEIHWTIPDTGGAPIARLGLELSNRQPSQGTVYLDYLDREGEPDALFGRPAAGGRMWQRAWVDAVERVDFHPPGTYRLAQNRGVGLLIQGSREWRDIRLSAQVRTYLAEAMGIALRVQGLERYYALTLARGGKARLIKALDGTRILAEADYPWELNRPYDLSLSVAGQRLQAHIDGEIIFDLVDPDRPLENGAAALYCREGYLISGPVRVQPNAGRHK